MTKLKIKIEGPAASGRTTLEKILREFLVSLEDDGRIAMVLRPTVEHEITVEIASVAELGGE